MPLLEKKLKAFADWKEELLTLAVAVACLVLFSFFPAGNPFQKMTSGFFFLFIVPALYIKLVLKKSLGSCGWQIGNWKSGLSWAFLSALAGFLLLYLATQYAGFFSRYSLPPMAYGGFGLFLFYEIFIAGFFLALYIFFFSGFFLSGFRKKTGSLAILVSAAFFAAFFLAASSFNWQNSFFIFLVFSSLIIAYKSRSLVYPLVAGLLFLLIADAVIIKFAK